VHKKPIVTKRKILRINEIIPNYCRHSKLPSLLKVDAVFSNIKRSGAYILIFLISSCLFLFFYEYLFTDDILIESIDINSELEKKGITKDIVGGMLYANMQDIIKNSTTLFKTSRIKSNACLYDMQLGNSNIKFNLIINFLRDIFKIPKTSIQASMIVKNGIEFIFVITEKSGKITCRNVYSEYEDIKKIVAEAAQVIMGVLDPYVLATYLLQIEESKCKNKNCNYLTPAKILVDLSTSKNLLDRKKALIGLGWIDFAQKQYDSAIKKYESALKIDSTFIPALYNLGSIYIELQNYFSARYFVMKSIDCGDNSPDTFTNLGSVSLNLCDCDRALLYSTLANNIKEDPEAYKTIGHVYTILNKYTDAIMQYNKGLILDSKDPEIYYSLAYCYDKLADYRMALELYDKSEQYINDGIKRDSILDLINKCRSCVQKRNIIDSINMHIDFENYIP